MRGELPPQVKMADEDRDKTGALQPLLPGLLMAQMYIRSVFCFVANSYICTADFVGGCTFEEF